jgi:hypothetical protein
MLMAPSTRTSVPFAGLSLVFPPSSERSVTLGSRVMAIDEPADAEPLRVKTRCATWFPGAGAFDASGIRFVDSWNVSMSEIVLAVAGLNSSVGGRFDGPTQRTALPLFGDLARKRYVTNAIAVEIVATQSVIATIQAK